MLEMDAGPQKIAKGALMRRDIWERLQVHWLHAQEMLQYCCQLKIIPGLWTHVVHEDKSLGTTGPHVEASAKLRRKGGQSLGSLLHKAAPSLLLHTRTAGPIL